jgi:flagellar FliL protein
MAEDEEDPEEKDDAEGESKSDGEEGKPKKSKTIVIVAGVLLLVIGGAAAAYFTGLFNSFLEGMGGPVPPPVAAAEKGPPFYHMPEMTIPLNASGPRPTYLKLQVSLELDSEADIKKIEPLLPRLIDHFHFYARELRPEDLKGAAGISRFREDLQMRANAAVAPVKVNDVLLKQLLVQ